MRRIRWLALVLGAVLASGVLAEGKSEGASGEAVTLSVWTWRNVGDQSIGYDNQMKRFQEKNPSIKIDLVRAPWNDYWAKLVPAIMAGTGPDVFLGHGGQTTTFVRDGVWAPVPQDVFSNSWMEQNVLESSRTQWFRDGRYYGMADESEAHALMYNVDHFVEAGLDPAKPPRTWEEMRQAAIKLTRRDASGKHVRSGYAIMTNDNDFQPTWNSMIMQMGASVFRDGKSAYGSAEARQALQYFVDLFRKDKVDVAEMPAWEECFRDGLASMVITEPAYQSIWYLQNPKLKFRVAPIPTVKAGAEPIWCDIGRWGWVVSSRTKHAPQAWALFKYVNSLEERVLRRIDPTYLLTYPPSVKSEGDDPRVKAFIKDKPDVQIWYEIANHGRWIGDAKNYTAYIRVVQPVIGKLWFENASVDSVLAEIVPAVNAFLAQ